MSAPRFAIIEKVLGETPLQALERFRATDSALANLPMTYAGRLDPMATGKLLILIGEECKRKESYTALDKEYEFEVLFDIGSDTGDVLGMPTLSQNRNVLAAPDLKRVVKEYVGEAVMEYPAYSSKTVAGKPLFQHAHDGTLEEIEMPTRTTHIYRLTYLGQRTIGGDEVLGAVLKKIETLQAKSDPDRPGSDFRKDEIVLKWQTLEGLKGKDFILARFSAIVSSGTYIRSLASVLSGRLSTTGLAFSIHRTAIGRYLSWGRHIGFWTKKLL